MKRYKTVDEFLENANAWQDEMTRLREILCATRLEETVKWGAPTYQYQGKNLVGIGGFKYHFGLWFFQGALLSDPNQVLINAQSGKTRAMRQWRMTSSKDIKARLIKSYVKEAIELRQLGKQIKPDRGKPIELPAILKSGLVKNTKAGSTFQQLSPGKQREYADYIAEAKRPETKLKRLDKIIPMIAAGKGLNDKYRNG